VSTHVRTLEPVISGSSPAAGQRGTDTVGNELGAIANPRGAGIAPPSATSAGSRLCSVRMSPQVPESDVARRPEPDSATTGTALEPVSQDSPDVAVLASACMAVLGQG